jgi:outer membrane protein
MSSRRALLLLLLAPGLAAAQAAAPPVAQPGASAATDKRIVTLDEAVRSALAQQPQLRQARASATAGVARSDEVRAGLLPQLDASGQVQRYGSNATSSTARATGAAGNGTAWSGQLSVGQALFDPNTYWAWRSAGSTALSLRDTTEIARLDVVSGVRAAYFAARADRDLAKVARETLTNDQAHLRQTEAFVEVGTQPSIALAQSKSAVATAQLTLIQADNAYANARAQLAQAMGLTAWDDFEVGDDTMPAVPGEDGSFDPLLAEALSARPELSSLRAQQDATEQTRAASRSGFLPRVSAQGTYSEAGPALDRTASSWTAGVNLAWSLFDGGLTSARVREADANLDSLRAQEEALRTSIRVALEQAVLGVRAARSSVQAATEAEVNAREQLRLAEGRYQAGAGSIIELGDAQVAASTAAAQRVQADYNLASARAALLRALGRGE